MRWGTAQIGREFVFRGNAHAVMKDVAEPGPFEVGRSHRLGLIACQEQRYRALSQPERGRAQFDQHQRLDGGEVLYFIYSQAVEVEPVRAYSARYCA